MSKYFIITKRKVLTATIALAGSVFLPKFSFGADTELDNMLKNIEKTVTEELKTTLSRLGLFAFAREFRDVRIRVAPLGYEKSDSFVNNSTKSLDNLSSFLNTPPSEFSFSVFTENSNNFLAAFEQNRKYLTITLDKIRSHSRIINKLTDNQIVQYQLLVAAVLSQNKNFIAFAASYTFIYPLCYIK